MVGVKELERVVTASREVHTPRLVVIAVELKHALKLELQQVEVVGLNVHANLPA